MRRASVGVLLLLPMLLSCRSWPDWRADAHCPVVLVESQQIDDASRLRQMIRFGEGEEHEVAIETVVQIGAEELVLVGFTPFGTRALTLRQRGRELDIEDRVARAMGVRAIWILDALHRSRFIEAPSANRGAAPLRWSWGGETVEERRPGTSASRIRIFHAAGSAATSNSDEAVRVEYSGADGASVRIENPWCGYRARIETLSTERSE